MDMVQALSGYITKMVSVGDSAAATSAAKMKILLLDSETVGLSVSLVDDFRILSDNSTGVHSLDGDNTVRPPQS
jgi:hypothetical protein